MFKVIIFLAACLTWSHCSANRYCSICQDHTMCKYQGLGKECVNSGGSGVSPQERQEIVDLHNSYRRTVASGEEKRGAGGPQPKAANLMKMVWDPELEKVAQRWADQCRFQHDTCRNDERFRVGQNLFWKWKYPDHQTNWTEAIASWYNEVAMSSPRVVKNYSFQSSTGHYTQMLWHSTYAIGCGRRDYGANKIYVCNYGPAGNWIGEPIYAIGEPCSECPGGTSCEDKLCAVQSKRHLSSGASVSEGEANLFYSDKLYKDIFGDTFDAALDVEKEQKTTGNSIDENEIDLDADTKKEIEEIKLRIEELLKNVIKKLKTKH